VLNGDGWYSERINDLEKRVLRVRYNIVSVFDKMMEGSPFAQPAPWKEALEPRDTCTAWPEANYS